MAKKTTNLHPLRNKTDILYPNVVEDNIPDTIQRKLTPGENITISDENVISANGEKKRYIHHITLSGIDVGDPAGGYINFNLLTTDPTNMATDSDGHIKATVDNTINQRINQWIPTFISPDESMRYIPVNNSAVKTPTDTYNIVLGIVWEGNVADSYILDVMVSNDTLSDIFGSNIYIEDLVEEIS